VSIERGSNEALDRTTSTTLRLQQNLWAGGRIDASVDAAQHMAKLARIGVLEAKTNVATRTLDVWQALLSSFGRRLVAQRDLDRLQLFADMIGRRVERDVSANVDTVLMRSRLTQVQSDLLAYASSQASAEQRLAQWVGTPSVMASLGSDKLTKTLEQAAETLPTYTLTETLVALEKQPALQRNSAEISLAEDEMRQKKGDAWPNIYMRLERQFTDAGSGGFDTKSVDTKLYLGLQYSPGPGMSLSSQIQAAQSKIAALQQDRESIRRDLQDRINTDWRDHITTAARLNHSKTVVHAATDVLDAYTRLFVVGRRGWLDVLNAARELSLAEQVLSDLQAQLVVGNYRLLMYQGQFDWQNGDELGPTQFER
jgi:adhesin transport system outer membrane protein